MTEPLHTLRQLLALLRAQVVIYQDAHWEVSGPQFYGDHLMFERLYQGVLGQIDTLAEKMVVMYGSEAVQATAVSRLTTWWVERWSKVDGLHNRGLQSEVDFEQIADTAYAQLEEADELSMGMDDFLMAMVNSHETNLYLLQQRQQT